MADLAIIYDTTTSRVTIKKLAAAQIESLDAAVITSGLIPHARISGLPYANLVLAASLVSGDIKSGQIGTNHFAVGQIVSAYIAALGIGTGHLANGAITSAKIGALAVGLGHITSGLRDPITTTPGLRTLGSGAQQAAAGNHTHTLTITEEWAAANAADWTNAQEWTTDRGPITVSSSKKIVVWLQIWHEYITTGSRLIEGQILVDDVQRVYVSGTLVDGHEGGANHWSPAEHWSGNGGVVKAQVKTEVTAARTRSRTGMYSVGV